ARELGIDHAGFDVAWVEGRPYVLEFNRLFGNRGMPELPQLIGAAMRGYLLGEASPDTPEPPMTFSA
ncbi:MAG TPA: hypothetical protein DCE38_08360, partial [Alcanivorax sp.]|nr:hypothetical protein [Alcanivorax sp.]